MFLIKIRRLKIADNKGGNYILTLVIQVFRIIVVSDKNPVLDSGIYIVGSFRLYRILLTLLFKICTH